MSAPPAPPTTDANQTTASATTTDSTANESNRSASSFSSVSDSSSTTSFSFVAASSMKCRWCNEVGEAFLIHLFPSRTFAEAIDRCDGETLPLCRSHAIQYSHILQAQEKEYTSQLPTVTPTESQMISASASAYADFLESDPTGRAFVAQPPVIVRSFNPESDPPELENEPEPLWCRACMLSDPPIGFDGRDLNQLHRIYFMRNRIDRPRVIPPDRIAAVAASAIPMVSGVWCNKHIGSILRLMRVYDPLKFNIRTVIWGPPPPVTA